MLKIVLYLPIASVKYTSNITPGKTSVIALATEILNYTEALLQIVTQSSDAASPF